MRREQNAQNLSLARLEASAASRKVAHQSGELHNLLLKECGKAEVRGFVVPTEHGEREIASVFIVL